VELGLLFTGNISLHAIKKFCINILQNCRLQTVTNIEYIKQKVEATVWYLHGILHKAKLCLSKKKIHPFFVQQNTKFVLV